MFKIDSDGATVGNEFTEGNPALSIPATVVSDEWLNAIQREVVLVIEENGITLNKLDDTQLNGALLEFFLRGGRKTAIKQVLANNTGPADVTGFLMNKSTSVSKIALFSIERKTDTQNVQEAGILFCTYDSADAAWRYSVLGVMDDTGVTFSIDNTDTDAAQLEYTTNDLTGASYVGNITLSAVFELRI